MNQSSKEIGQPEQQMNNEQTADNQQVSPSIANAVLYAGLAWKHHISEDFESGNCPLHPNGAGKGATIFINYEKMIEYLKKDGRRWHVAELLLENEPLIFEFGNNYMATIQRDYLSQRGFMPCI